MRSLSCILLILVLVAYDLIIVPFWTTGMHHNYAVTQEHARLEADESAKVWVALNSSSYLPVLLLFWDHDLGVGIRNT